MISVNKEAQINVILKVKLDSMKIRSKAEAKKMEGVKIKLRWTINNGLFLNKQTQ